MGAKESTTQKVSTLTPAQSQLLSDLIFQISGEVGRGGPVYQGEVAPGASPLQQQLFGAASAFLGSPYAQGQPAYEVDPAARERIYDAQRNQAMQDYQDFTRMAAEQYNARGAGRSGGLQRSYAQGAGRLANQLNLTRAGLEYQDEQARRQALESGANRGLQAQQFGLNLLGQTGDLQRNIEGQQNLEAYQRWQMGQTYANPWLQYLPTALGTQAFTPGVFSQDQGLFPGGLPIGPWTPAVA